MKTRKNYSQRELPPSSYEVIRLPTPSPPPDKGLCDQQSGTKRPKVAPEVTGQVDNSGFKEEAKNPWFLKSLMKRNVSESFLMGIPNLFSSTYLPTSDTSFVLENETGKEYKMDYLAQTTEFGEGWKEFSLGEKLLEEDGLEFHLVNQTKFKVLKKPRKNDLGEVKGTHFTIKLAGRVEQNDGSTLKRHKEIHQAPCFEEAASGDVEKVQEDMPLVAIQVDESQSNVEERKFPRFIKTLVKSDVSGDFMMEVPEAFSGMHLPPIDTQFVLEYENGKQYMVIYAAQNAALSGGWKEISLAENLSEGNILVFLLVNSSKFKVHKLRSGLNPVDGDRMLDYRVEQIAYGDEGDKNLEQIAYGDEGDKNLTEMEIVPSPPVVSDYNGFTNVDDFIASLDELLKKEYDLPHHIKWSYHQLCCSQKSILHTNLPEDLNPLIIAGCITDLVDIANQIRSCEPACFEDSLIAWDRKLKYLELLGMNVKFLTSRLFHVQTIARSSEIAKSKQRYSKRCSEHAECENKIKSLLDQLSELRRFSARCADDMEKRIAEIKEHELRVRNQVSAPW